MVAGYEMDGIMTIIIYLVEKLKKLTDILTRPLKNRLHCYLDLRVETKFGIRYGTDYNEGATDSFHEAHPPK